MEFQISKDMLFSDTLVPDIFICDIMPTLPSDCVKVYIYGLFYVNITRKLQWMTLQKLGLSRDSLNAALVLLEMSNL